MIDTRWGSSVGRDLPDIQQFCYQIVSGLFGIPLGVYEPDEIGDGMVPEDDGYVLKTVWTVKQLGIDQFPGIVA
jgi:hypothetical protein